MVKRILSVMLCAVMLISAFSLQAFGQEEVEPPAEEQSVLEILRQLREYIYVNNESQRLRKQILDIHITTLEQTGRDSMGGLCGGQVSWELYLLGINRFLMTYHGKDHYDYYSNLETTSGGYNVLSYSAGKYSLLEAMQEITKNGTVDVYNVMLCFEKTGTEAGAEYGHVVFLHGILDGMVYAVEGFSTGFGTIEGEAIVVTMEELAQWYDTWTEFEGLVYFGTKSPVDSCKYYPADLFVECDTPAQLLSLPDSQRGQKLRQINLGERVRATGLYENMRGQRYYRIQDDSGDGFVAAEQVSPLVFRYDSIHLENAVFPQLLNIKQQFLPKGKIVSEFLQLENTRLIITDSQGQERLHVKLSEDRPLDLGYYPFRQQVDVSKLEAGVYTYSILADTKNHYYKNGEFLHQTQTVCIASVRFGIGQTELPEQPQTQPRQIVRGWDYADGKWYYYENGEPRTGWFGYKGHDYYLDETGAALTGWAVINGKQRFFTQTGSMRTGWLSTEEGVFYFLRNGVVATGWRNVDGGRYCFDDQGKMLSGGWTELDGRLYYFREDGRAATGWVTLKSGVYSFHVDGHLLAKQVQQDGKTQIIAYDGTWKPE